MGSDGWGQPLQNIPLEVVLGFWEGLGKQQEPEARGIVELGSVLRCGAVCEPGKASWERILGKDSGKGSWKGILERDPGKDLEKETLEK